ncbi:MAG: HAMP domain-containing histidine kinase [Acidobacteria bacterium]|nr:HAMP domain-containing histidine kinase [Acidobacteriota bacterium]
MTSFSDDGSSFELRQEIEKLRRQVQELEQAGHALERDRVGAQEERQRIGDALRLSREHFRALFEHSPAALWEVDGSALVPFLASLRSSGLGNPEAYFTAHPEQALAAFTQLRVLEANQAAVALYEAESKEQVLAGLTAVLSGESYPALVAILTALAQGRHRLATEAVHRTFSGRRIEVELKLLVAPGAEADLSRLLLAATDITERKQAERTLEEARTQLKRQVAERTAALAATHEELKSFLYTVSHDLRTPLINVKGFSDELRATANELRATLEPYSALLPAADREVVERTLSMDLPEAVDFIDSAINRINHFMGALLRLSQEGKRELHMERVDARSLVEEILPNLSYALEQRHGEVAVGRLPWVIADRTSLEQIFSHLLSNAVLYLDPARPGRVEVRGRREEEFVVFEIEDNGRGIAAEELPKVFAPFRRGSHEEVEGEGMGLAYVQALVRRHGGRLWCRSEAGTGSLFCFTLSNRIKEADLRNTMEILLP